MKNLYKILGVNQNASHDEIRRAYKKLAMTVHSDKVGGDVEKMKLLNEAHFILGEPGRRKQYNAQMEAFDLTDVTMESSVEITGFIESGNIQPYSHKFRNKHAVFIEQFTKNTLKNHQLLSLSFESSLYDLDDKILHDIFSLQKLKQHLKNNNDIALPLMLTPNAALHLFMGFLSGDCYGSNLDIIKKYFASEIAKKELDPSNTDLPFYQGIFSILLMTEHEPSSKLIDVIKNITDYAKQTSEFNRTAILPLFYNKYFRNLYKQALHLHWHSQENIFQNEHLALYDGYIHAEKLLNDTKERFSAESDTKNLVQLTRFIRLLYNLEKDWHRPNIPELTAKDYRERAFHFLDWVPAIQECGGKDIILNMFIQIGVHFQLASRLESIPTLQMTDEKLAFEMYLIAIELGHHETPDKELYAHIHTIKYLKSFQFDHVNLTEYCQILQNRTQIIADFFPFYEPIQSNTQLFNDKDNILPLMRALLTSLVKIYEYNNTHNDFIDTHHSASTILYKAYEACLKNWYQETHDPDLEKKFRIDLMDTLLLDKGFTFLDIEPHITSPWIMVDRDELGWMRPVRTLPYEDNPQCQIYRSINGAEINQETGNIHFFLTEWNATRPLYEKLFTQFDLQEMLERKLTAAIFSLDPVDPDKPYHPFNHMRFSPNRLYETEFLNTMFLTDYILKFLTTNQEVQGLYPFDQRPTSSMISHLPGYLRKIIDDFQAASHSGEIHRFWIQAEEMHVTMPDNIKNTKVTRIGVQNLKMIVKKHRMERDINGDLKDVANDDEGWPIYVLTAEQVELLLQKQIIIEGSAMIFVHGHTKLLFWEHHSVLQEHIPKDYRETLIRLFLQPRTQEGKITPNVSNMQLLYRTTKDMARQSGLSSRYSPEFIFAQEFTNHYDEFAQYLPEFGRLKELCKISSLIRILASIRKSNKQSIAALDALIHASPPLSTLTYKHYSEIQIDIYKNVGLNFNNFRNSVVKMKAGVTDQLKTIKRQIGVINSSNSSHYRSEVYKLFSEDLLKSITSTAYGSAVDAFMKNNLTPLANALIDYNMEQIYKDIQNLFPHSTKHDIASALKNDEAALARISANEAKKEFNEIRMTDQKFERLFSNMHLGVNKEKFDLDTTCMWAPASVRHEVSSDKNRYSFFVYGGVNAQARLNISNGNGALNGSRVDGSRFQNHHIISNKNPLTANHELLKLSGVNLNSRVNMIYLPKNPSDHSTRSVHNGRHNNIYSQGIQQRMDQIVEQGKINGWTQQQYRSEQRNMMSGLRQELRSGNIALNKHCRPWSNK